MTTILPTSRAIRAEILREREHNTFLPRYISIGEFLQRAVIVEGHRRIDDDTRTLLLLEATDFKRFGNLQIERNFFTFTQNATYLFRFFEELSGELVDISALELADTYGDYEEHILILGELFNRYKALCEEKKILDPIFLPQYYTLNQAYIKNLGAIKLIAEGYLTNFEMKLLQEISALTPVKIIFYANNYNQKMQSKFCELGIPVENEMMQTIDLSNRLLVERASFDTEAQIRCESFSERLLQVAFIKQKVFEFIEMGIAPEKIAVVLPDESFAEHLRYFDSENNFNFAMGLSVAKSSFVEKIEAVMAYLDHQSVENQARLNRVGPDLLQIISPRYKVEIGECDFLAIMQDLLKDEPSSEIKKIVDEELYLFEKILPVLSGSTLKSALYLFVNRLKNKSIDDVRGGKVTVMGVLETRSVTYDGVIVVDFNEDIVPRRSEKDLFLNSATRIKAGLPGAEDRESLQKLYYHNLFMRASQVAISYVEAADAVPSRFLTQLGITARKVYDDNQWASVLFRKQGRQKLPSAPVIADYDFTLRPLSATGLKIFLSCKRRFYHRYVEGLKSHEIAKDMPQEHEIGTALHNALRDVYQAESRFTEKEELKEAIFSALQSHNGSTPLDAFLHKLWMRRLDPFVEHEIERFKSAEVLECEVSLKCQIDGMTLAGQIDRIDRTSDGLEVLDYKSGKYPVYSAKTVEKATDFQLEFYYLLAQKKGEVDRCGYYDLKSGKIVYEELLEMKLQLLKEHLNTLQSTKRFDFEQTEDYAACRFCDYVHLCQREL
ncbi:MAG: PD-(D/E)XK nuclease family protein [Campylobacterota bacterium]|nr:PD-(D/E)XK nuclease family protein [Campylobacterota bacterium]